MHGKVETEKQHFRKEELKKGIVHFTYKSIQATIFRNRRLRVEREDNKEFSCAVSDADFYLLTVYSFSKNN